MRKVLPTTAGSAAKARRQNESERTATGLKNGLTAIGRRAQLDAIRQAGAAGEDIVLTTLSQHDLVRSGLKKKM